MFGVFFAPFLEEEISDYLTQDSFIRVLTVSSPDPVAHSLILLFPLWAS